jgi:hypothetical protein
MSTLQKMLDASRRGTAHGMQNAQQMQQLFAQKDQMERQVKQDEYKQKQDQLANITGLLGSGSPSAVEQGAILLKGFTKKNQEIFGGEVDIVGQVGKKEMNEVLQGAFDELKKATAEYGKKDHGIYTPETYAAVLRNIGMNIAGEDSNFATNLRARNKAQLESAKKAIVAEKQHQNQMLQIAARKKSGETADAASKKITMMMDKLGVDETTATGLVTGVLVLNTDPVSGETVMVNKFTQTSTPITPKGDTSTPAQPAKPEEKPPTLWELSDESTGAMSAARAGASAITGQIGLPIAEKTLYARQRVDSAKQKLVRALANNPRYPIGEMKIIREEIDIDSSVFDSPRGLRVRMRAIDDYLNSQIATNQEIASDTKMPKSDRQDALKAIKAMESFLEEMGVPEEGNKAVKLTDKQQEYMELYPPKDK